MNTDRLSFQAGGSEKITSIENVIGSQGNDRITGNGKKNIIEGSGGSDTFVFNSLDGGTDTIKDFNYDQGDRLEFSRSTFGSGDDLNYDFNSGDLFFKDDKIAILSNKPSFSSVSSGAVFT